MIHADMGAEKRRGRRILLASGIVVLLIVVGYGVWVWHQPLPLITPQLSSSSVRVATAAPQLTWPAVGQAAVGVLGTDVLETHGTQTAAPTASTAKIITALMILRQKPLQAGQQGPVVTLTTNDVNLYKAYAAADGSLVPVQAGEQISEYQMLQAMMLPSANNIADSLAIWAYGSLAAYQTAANGYVQSLGLRNTHIGTDASGLDPSTTSTASDLVKLGSLAMQSRVLAQIVGQATASDIPIAGTVKNVNMLLGTNGIVGVKTGNSDQAGGVYVAAANVLIAGKQQTVVTALMGAPNLFAALKTSVPLITTAQANFQSVNIVKAGTQVGNYRLPWGSTVPVVVTRDIQSTTWRGAVLDSHLRLQPLRAGSQEQTAGQVSIGRQTIASIQLQHPIPSPPIWWRFLHPRG